jgi:hypothetical protein
VRRLASYITPNSTEYLDKGLASGHEYWYKINAQNYYGISENTTAVSATTYSTSTTSNSFFNYLILFIIIVLIVVVIMAELSRIKKAKPRSPFKKKRRAGVSSRPGKVR